MPLRNAGAFILYPFDFCEYKKEVEEYQSSTSS